MVAKLANSIAVAGKKVTAPLGKKVAAPLAKKGAKAKVNPQIAGSMAAAGKKVAAKAQPKTDMLVKTAAKAVK